MSVNENFDTNSVVPEPEPVAIGKSGRAYRVQEMPEGGFTVYSRIGDNYMTTAVNMNALSLMVFGEHKVQTYATYDEAALVAKQQAEKDEVYGRA